MKITIQIKRTVALIPLALFLASVGCTEQGAAPAALSISQVPEAMEKVFKNAPPEIKQKIEEALADLKRKEADKALVILQDLSNQPNLTPKQRQVTASSLLAVNAEVQSAAASGDQNAAVLVQYRRMSK